jgi:transposase-like protein
VRNTASKAARRFFHKARTTTGVVPVEVITDRAPTYPRVLDEMWPAAWHHVERYANNRVEADHAQLKRRLRPMRGIKTMTGLRVIAAVTRWSRTSAAATTRSPPAKLTTFGSPSRSAN